jgi:hypothetical protein
MMSNTLWHYWENTINLSFEVLDNIIITASCELTIAHIQVIPSYMYPVPLVAPIAHIQVIPSYMYPAPLVAPIAHIQVIPSYMYI